MIQICKGLQLAHGKHAVNTIMIIKSDAECLQHWKWKQSAFFLLLSMIINLSYNSASNINFASVLGTNVSPFLSKTIIHFGLSVM